MALMIIPVLLLTFLAIDGGGLFLAWIGINGVSREAANYAATHPTAWGTPGNAAAQAAYASIITNGAASSRCDLGSPPPTLAPTLSGGGTVGGTGQVNTATASIRCHYTFFTPLMNGATGGGFWLGATTAIPIRVGVISGLPVSSAVPVPSSAPSTEPSPSPAPSPSPTPPPSAAPSPSPSPAPVNCVVPNLVGTTRLTAPVAWTSAYFTGPIEYSPSSTSLFPLDREIGGQSLVAGTTVACTGSITVTPVCIVPNFVNSIRRGDAQAAWTAASFTGTVTFSPSNLSAFPSTMLVGGQSLVAGSRPGCSSNITLTKN